MSARIYGGNVAIDPQKVAEFFGNRFCQENPLASVMVRGSADDAIADIRNNNEARLLLQSLQITNKMRILDIGCGIGRWAENMKGHIALYCGVDFTEQYIEAAKELYKERANHFLHCMSATQLSPSILEQEYDLIIINGLCVYLNDEEVAAVMKPLEKCIAAKGYFYFRESVSTIAERLTLRDFFSEELCMEYNAIYRTPDEYRAVLATYFTALSLIDSGLLLDVTTGSRAETNQQYWLFQRLP